MKRVQRTQMALFQEGDDLPLFADQPARLVDVPEYRTEDGKIVHPGDRVYNYYDCEWGIIDAMQSPYKRDGWFDFTSDAGARRILNGARISTYQPSWAK